KDAVWIGTTEGFCARASFCELMVGCEREHDEPFSLFTQRSVRVEPFVATQRLERGNRMTASDSRTPAIDARGFFRELTWSIGDRRVRGGVGYLPPARCSLRFDASCSRGRGRRNRRERDFGRRGCGGKRRSRNR